MKELPLYNGEAPQAPQVQVQKPGAIPALPMWGQNVSAAINAVGDALIQYGELEDYGTAAEIGRKRNASCRIFGRPALRRRRGCRGGRRGVFTMRTGRGTRMRYGRLRRSGRRRMRSWGRGGFGCGRMLFARRRRRRIFRLGLRWRWIRIY